MFTWGNPPVLMFQSPAFPYQLAECMAYFVICRLWSTAREVGYLVRLLTMLFSQFWDTSFVSCEMQDQQCGYCAD